MIKKLGILCAAGLLASGSMLQAQPAQPASETQIADDDPALRPIAPELRPGARIALENTRRMGSITAAAVVATRSNPLPAPPRLDDVLVEERMIPGGEGAPQVKVFVINAQPGTSRPAILHTHGGGFLLGTAATDVPRLQALARDLNAVIVSVEYRLAPETDWRGSTEDNYAGLRWLYDNAAALGVDRSRIAVMGESAGGGHAALLAIRARDRGEIPLALQVLIYPMLDDRTGGAVQMPAHIATVGWSASENQEGWRAFLGQEPGTDSVPAEAVPARTASLEGLPPAFIAVGGADLFVIEDIEYAQRLVEAGVPTELLVVPGAYHGFDFLSAGTAAARQFDAAKVSALRQAFGLGQD